MLDERKMKHNYYELSLVTINKAICMARCFHCAAKIFQFKDAQTEFSVSVTFLCVNYDQL